MSRGTQSSSQIDQLLTNVSQKIMPKNYISEMILPLLNVGKYTGKIGRHGNEHLRIVNTVTGGKKTYATVQSGTRTSDRYEIDSHALKDFVTDEDFRNYEKPFDARRDITSKLITQLWLGKEKSLADALFDTAVITQNLTLAGTDQYNDYDNSDPIGDAVNAHGTIEDATGLQADTCIMDSKTFRTLKYHPAILDALGFKDNRPGGLTPEEVSKALDVERLIIGSAVYNDSKEGEADNMSQVWGKGLLYAILPKTAQLDQVSLGYRCQLAGQKPRQVFRNNVDEPVGAEKIICMDKYDQVITKVEAGFLIKDSIA